MKLIPASRAAWMIRIDSSWSLLPHSPNIIAPRQSGLTWTPVLPSARYSIRPRLSVLRRPSVQEVARLAHRHRQRRHVIRAAYAHVRERLGVALAGRVRRD